MRASLVPLRYARALASRSRATATHCRGFSPARLPAWHVAAQRLATSSTCFSEGGEGDHGCILVGHDARAVAGGDDLSLSSRRAADEPSMGASSRPRRGAAAYATPLFATWLLGARVPWGAYDSRSVRAIYAVAWLLTRNCDMSVPSLFPSWLYGIMIVRAWVVAALTNPRSLLDMAVATARYLGAAARTGRAWRRHLLSVVRHGLSRCRCEFESSGRSFVLVSSRVRISGRGLVLVSSRVRIQWPSSSLGDKHVTKPLLHRYK